MQTLSKLTLITLSVITFALGCKNASTETNTLEEKKALLLEKTNQIVVLESEAKILQDEIAKADPKQELSVLQVTTMTVIKQDFNRYVELQASVITDDIYNVSSEMGGRITFMKAKEGDKVSKGQLIASVDVESMDRQKDEILKSLDLANEVYDRQKRLWDQNIGSEVQYLQTKNSKERLEKSIQTLNTQLKKKNVYAPITGIVDKVYLKQGEMSGPSVPIVTIINTTKVKVVADAPETFLGKVKVGEKVAISFPALAKEVTEKVTQLGRTIDPANRTFKIEIAMNNTNGELKPNLLSVIKVNDYTEKNALFIPVDLIQQEVSGKKYLYIVKNENNKKVALKTYITTGESAHNEIVITTGLSANDEIIVKGAKSVSEGQPLITELVPSDK